MILEAKEDHRWVYKRGRARYTKLRFPRLAWFESMYNEGAEAFEAGDIDQLMTAHHGHRLRLPPRSR
jgi:hypothetical protein